MKLAISKVLIRALSVANILFAAFALFYGALMTYGVLTAPHDSTPYFYQAFAIFTAYSASLSLLLIFFAVAFFRLRTNRWWQFSILCAVAYMLLHQVGGLWLHPSYGDGIATATGVGLGGLMPQELSYFYFWGPAVAFGAHVLLHNEQIAGASG